MCVFPQVAVQGLLLVTSSPAHVLVVFRVMAVPAGELIACPSGLVMLLATCISFDKFLSFAHFFK